ncbi:ATP-binding cassette sub-family C member 3-like [Bacillus rossius redtenbacheri]|uniref:ATP-binding cassette sub-family C member 3-like n=1 Tax=Bacillus rossius redtenbacheri TaxID=93214 RepID=UPI002FDDC6AD
MTHQWVESICGSPFWDANLTWHTADPDVTPCVERTVLLWLPCAALWALCPVEATYILHSKARDVPWNWRSVSKLVLIGVLTVLCLTDLAVAFHNHSMGQQVYPVAFCSPIIEIATLMVSAALIVFMRERGLRTSGPLFIFWLLLVVCGAPQFRTELRALSGDFDVKTVTYLIHYPVVVVLFFLHCLVDLPPAHSYYPIPEKPCPEKSASFPSRVIFKWIDPLVWRGFRTSLEMRDLFDLNPEDYSRVVVPKFDKHWDSMVARVTRDRGVKASFRKSSGSVSFPGKPRKDVRLSLLGPLLRAFGSTFLFSMSLRFTQDLLAFVNPQILKYMIAFVESDDPDWKGYMYAALMLVCGTVQTFFQAHYFIKAQTAGMRVRSSLIAAIYRKALRISVSARKDSTVGEMVNLMAVDTQRIMDLCHHVNLLWSAPLQISLALYFLWDLLGPSALAGMAVLAVFIPINSVIANAMKKLQIRQMKMKDRRIKMMNEVLGGIRVLKQYAWEPSYQKHVQQLRGKEIAILKQAAYLQCVTSFFWTCAPFLVSLASFATFVLLDENNVLNAQTAFVSLSLFNIMRHPLTLIPQAIAAVIQASVSLRRLNDYINKEELSSDSVTHDLTEKDPLVIEKGDFSWGPEEPLVLRRVDLRVRQGSLVAVVGSVGSGKSSLLSALLGELVRVSGRVNTKGSVAYVPQQAWIQNAPLRDNIVFGQPLSNRRYYRVVDACALKQDFQMLPGGDQTEIGEKGINLSGGQKQRVSLARAVYCQADVYLMDDPLSAVDSHVGRHIFEEVIGPYGLLRRKTRVLVTHGITFLPEVDHIVVLKEGEITEEGTYKDLLEKKGAFADFLVQHLQDTMQGQQVSPQTDVEELKQHLERAMGRDELQRRLSQTASSLSGSRSSLGDLTPRAGSLRRQKSVSSTEDSMNVKFQGTNGIVQHVDKLAAEKSAFKSGKKLIQAEAAKTGSVKWQVYGHYFMAIGVGYSLCALISNAVLQGFQVGSNIWLSVWSTNGYGDANGSEPRSLYLGVYGALGLGQVLSVTVSTLTVSIGTLNAAMLLHNKLLWNVMRLPQSLFDTTPIGRILTRFSSDVNVLDGTFSMILRQCIPNIYRVAGTLLVIVYSTPLFVAVIIPLAFIYCFIQKIYVSTSRQLKRLESIMKAPILSHFGESLTGVSTIRAYRVQDRFTKESELRVDNSQKCYNPIIIANRWLSIRLEAIGNMVIFFSSLFAVLGRHTMDSGIVGLSISYAMQITQALNMLVRQISDIETNIVAVERIKEYSEFRQEAPWVVESDKVPDNWPSEGRVEFHDYQVRYREGLDLVLHGISFTIEGGEKVGIVGRTGAGKSSITLGLFRIIEPAGGAILIDGIDVTTLGLHTLRSRLTIIPQDPVLFSGTLRRNLDPFEELPDAELWQALGHAHLEAFVRSLPAGLGHEVSEGGENLSVGQRQLICLARALLRKTKILVLDEATAAIDLETDDLIQETIRTKFKDCTILTIAHRLNTIMDSNRVIVLDKGRVVEFDTVSNLLEDKASVFYGMAMDAGLV